MNTKNLHWLTYGVIEPNSIDLAFNKRLNHFGYIIMQEAVGESKIRLGALAALDIIINKENPNIVIFCPNSRMWEWYEGILTRLGIEFKCAVKGDVAFISDITANFLIIDEKSFEIANTKNWDLIIIDGEFKGYDIDLESYKLKGNSEKMVIFTPAPIKEESMSKETVPFFTYNGGDFITGGQSDVETTVKILSYNGDLDKKLEILLDKVRKIIINRENNIVIYFREKKTLDMVYTVLTAEFPVRIKKIFSRTADNAALERYLLGMKNVPPRIILAKDDIASSFPYLPSVTHIMNYEYPKYLYAFLQRFRRRGKNSEISPLFYLFTEGEFPREGKMPKEEMFSYLYKMYSEYTDFSGESSIGDALSEMIAKTAGFLTGSLSKQDEPGRFSLNEEINNLSVGDNEVLRKNKLIKKKIFEAKVKLSTQTLEDIAQLSDSLKIVIAYNVWRNSKVEKSYKNFLKKYFKG